MNQSNHIPLLHKSLDNFTDTLWKLQVISQKEFNALALGYFITPEDWINGYQVIIEV